jgi:hypothetical protein
VAGLLWGRATNVWGWDRAHQQFKGLDRAIHLIEPPGLWPRYSDHEFRDRVPSGVTQFAGDLRLAHHGQPWGRVTSDADAPRRRQGHDFARNQARWRPFEARGWTAKVQLEAMALEGIDVAVIYPSRCRRSARRTPTGCSGPA